MGIGKKIYLGFENLIMTSLVPERNVGPIFHWIFKFPLLLDRLGLWFLIPKGILILATTGRRSGKPRRTPMEYGKIQPDGTYVVMSGWAGRTDWYRNAIANPEVMVKIGRKTFEAVAEPLSQEEVAELIKDILEFNPASLSFFMRWSGPIEPGAEGLKKAAAFFPSLRLKPLGDHPIFWTRSGNTL
jgi:deazaflavin-dependent oxidoreductase (nitroreductase family)